MMNKSTIPCRYGIHCRKIANGCEYLHDEVESNEKNSNQAQQPSKSYSQSNHHRNHHQRHASHKQIKNVEDDRQEPDNNRSRLKRTRDRS